ncbi:MAG: hypothetical protein AB7G37_20120 [Solirubrobacteraceae bacterium]
MEPVPVQQARARYTELMIGPRGLLELDDPNDPRTSLVPASALVFALGAWEGCCEALLRAAAVAVTGAARRPDDLPKVVRAALLETVGQPGEPWEHLVARLHGSWHKLAVRHLGRALQTRFRYWNTPSGQGVDRLAEEIAGMAPISTHWPAIDGHPGADVLDDAITRRGRAVHLAQVDLEHDEVAATLDLLDAIVDTTCAIVARRIGHLPPVNAV